MTDPRLHEWLLRWEDGDLSPQEIEELSELLRRDPAARQELRLHSMMTSGISQLLPPALQQNLQAAPAPSRPRLALVAAAAVVLVALVLAALFSRRGVEPKVAGVDPQPAPAMAEKPAPGPEAPKPAPLPLPVAPVPAPEPKEPVPPPVAPSPAPSPESPKPAPLPRPEPRPEQPAPAPLPEREQKSPPATVTVTVVAKLERVAGQVFVLAGSSKSPAKAGQDLFAGQSLEAVGRGAEAVILFRDQSRLFLAADARVSELSDTAGGRRLIVARGTVAVDLAAQGDTRPFTLDTAQAEIRGSGAAYFLVSGDGESTRVDVGLGRIHVMRLSDSRAIDVSAGQFANVAPGGDLAARALLRQDKKKKGKKDLEFEFKVNAAIQGGVNYLRGIADQATVTPNSGFATELVLWSLQHGGLPESDPVFQKLLQSLLASELQRTYQVSLQAMILEELDRVKYQVRIAQCAQFLIDNQGRNGQWSYGEPVPPWDMTPTTGKSKKDVATPGKADSKESKEKDRREKPKVLQKIGVVKRRDGPAGGDNSNSQYAALGLRACHDAGIILPPEVLKKAQSWWRGAQEATKKMEPAGWTYGEAPSPGGRTAYGSMTAGAAGSLILYHYMLGEPWLKDDAVQKGLEWMRAHFSVTENPGRADVPKDEYTWHYYYLYALERLGILFGTETMGAHDWYQEGATYLLKMQKEDGSWNAKPGDGFILHDTCFAILFLRRATRPLNDVATLDRR